MEPVVLDTLGLKCPKPLLKVAAKSPEMKPGQILEVIGNCPTFERDMKTWCDRLKKPLLASIDEGGGKIRCQIQF